MHFTPYRRNMHRKNSSDVITCLEVIKNCSISGLVRRHAVLRVASTWSIFLEKLEVYGIRGMIAIVPILRKVSLLTYNVTYKET